MPYADLEDIALYVDDLRGDAVPADLVDKTEELIEEAEDMISEAATAGGGASLAVRIDAGELRARAVIRVEREMVAGVLQNPGCYISSSESVGGVSQSRTLDLKTATGRLVLTDAQRQLLGLPTSSKTRGGGKAFTINPTSGAGPRVLDTSPWG